MVMFVVLTYSSFESMLKDFVIIIFYGHYIGWFVRLINSR